MLQQHIQLAVLDGHEAVIIERLSKPGAIGLVSQAGGRLPLHCSAAGKVLLPHAGSALCDALTGHGLSRFTPHTITDPVRLVVRSSSVALPEVVPSVVASGPGISRRLGWTPGER